MTIQVDATEEIVQRLMATRDPQKKTEIVGLQHQPSKDGDVVQHCGNCVYFHPNHKHCSQPQLDRLPVASDWWCRLWRA